MDLVTGATVAGMFGAALEKASEAAVKNLTDDAIDAGQSALGRLVAWVKGKFSSAKEVGLLEELVKRGYNKDEVVTALGSIIENELRNDTVSWKEISAIVADVERENPELHRNTARDVSQIANGNGNVQIVNSQVDGGVRSGSHRSATQSGRHAY